MAIILIEEVLMGLDDVRDSLVQAMTTLEGLVEDIHPAMGEHLREALEHELLVPVQSRVAKVDQLLEEFAAMS